MCIRDRKRYAEELGVEVVAVETELYGDVRNVEIAGIEDVIESMSLDKSDAILFKASRVVGLETIVNKIVV